MAEPPEHLKWHPPHLEKPVLIPRHPLPAAPGSKLAVGLGVAATIGTGAAIGVKTVIHAHSFWAIRMIGVAEALLATCIMVGFVLATIMLGLGKSWRAAVIGSVAAAVVGVAAHLAMSASGVRELERDRVQGAHDVNACAK